MIRSLSLAAALLASPALAEEVTYDFQDPKAVNGIAFLNDSPLEPFVGFGHGVAGEVTFDVDAPETFGGSITVAADTLQVTNEQMTQHMLSDGWLAASEGAVFEATFDEVESVSTDDTGVSLIKVKGQMKYGPIAVDKVFDIEATLVPDGAAARGPKTATGDLLVLRSDFTIDRTDFGIKPEMDGSEVAKQIYVMVRIVGYVADAE